MIKTAHIGDVNCTSSMERVVSKGFKRHRGLSQKIQAGGNRHGRKLDGIKTEGL